MKHKLLHTHFLSRMKNPDKLSLEKSLKSLDEYKEVAKIVEEVEIALGKKQVYRSKDGSTSNFEISNYGTYSST